MYEAATYHSNTRSILIMINTLEFNFFDTIMRNPFHHISSAADKYNNPIQLIIWRHGLLKFRYKKK